MAEFQPEVPTRYGGRTVGEDVSPADPALVLAATDSGGVFRSTDSGAHWSHVDSLVPFRMEDLKFAPNNASVVVATTARTGDTANKGGIWRSTNAGVTWTRATINGTTCPGDNGDFDAWGIAFEQSTTNVYVATNCGPMVSSNQGATFTRTAGSKTVLARPGSIANIAVSYTSQGSISTPGESVDSLSPRAMNKAQQRLGSLWLTQTVRSGNHAAVRWYEVTNLTGTPSIRQQSTYSPTNQHRFMAALAVDKQGNMAIGYNISSSSLNPGIRYAGRLVTDPLNTLGQSETTLFSGTGAPSSGNFNRWGDYSEMSVDPVDGCTFWFTGEYYAVTGANWQTRIGSFKYPGCV